MSEHDDGIGDAQAKRIAANIDLAFRFLGEAFDEPARLERIPDGASLVFVPDDDPDLAQANLARAVKLADEGHPVDLVPLGDPVAAFRAASTDKLAVARTPSGERVIVRDLQKVHLSEAGREPTQVAIVYDRTNDVLLVDLHPTSRPAVVLPPIPGGREYLSLRVDPDTAEVVGVRIEAFLALAVEREPFLLRALAIAEVRGANDFETFELRRRGEAASRGQWDAESFLAEIERLIA